MWTHVKWRAWVTGGSWFPDAVLRAVGTSRRRGGAVRGDLSVCAATERSALT